MASTIQLLHLVKSQVGDTEQLSTPVATHTCSSVHWSLELINRPTTWMKLSMEILSQDAFAELS